jgi:DNA polymerase (family 10)
VAGIEDIAPARGFLETTAVALHLGRGSMGEAVLQAHEGVETRVHLVEPAQVETRLLRVTGPEGHANELLVGIEDEALTESDIYARTGRVWIPPPARGLPAEKAAGVVRLGEIRGDLHLHSDRSPDGRMTLDQILVEAVDRGYEYVLISDHTSGLRFGGLDEDGLRAQRAAIEEARDRFPDLLVLHGAELNIGRDGSLDIGAEALGGLDMAVAGLHSYFDLDRSEQTARVLEALTHPVVRVLAHPTGRRIGTRPGVDLDIEAVIAAAIENEVALEVNGHRDRLDLSAEIARTAVEAGALLAANSDAHRLGEMGNVFNSVSTMQRAGVAADAVVNTMPVGVFREWLSGSRDGLPVGSRG